jgi:signal transduction histidine kinase
MDDLKQIGHHIIRCGEAVLHADEALTEEQHDFIQIILENTHRLLEDLAALPIDPAEHVPGTAHHLLTPLSSVIGYSEVLVNEMCGPVTPFQRDCLDQINRAGNQLRDTIVHVFANKT